MSLTLGEILVMDGYVPVKDGPALRHGRLITESELLVLAVEHLKGKGAVEAESTGVTFYDMPEGFDGLILAVPSQGWDLKPVRYLVVPLEALEEK